MPTKKKMGRPRKHEDERRQLTIYLPKTLAIDLKVHCAQKEETISDIAEIAIAEYLKRRKK